MNKNDKTVNETKFSSGEQATGLEREHAEFHNSYLKENIIDDIRFLQVIYKEKIDINPEMVNRDFINNLKVLGKKIYFFILGLENGLTPQDYIKYKFDFI